MQLSSKTSYAPLEGIVAVEFAGIGPGPFCAMLLADLGARVIRVDRPISNGKAIAVERLAQARSDVLGRSKWSIALDLKSADSRSIAEALLTRADVLIEGYRPGVMERLGYGPEDVLALNPAIIYARMTGWGQTGPLSSLAGHDLNYISLSGVLSMIGPAGGPPSIPLNLIGDFGGGGMYMAYAIAAALGARGEGRRGVVIDAAMSEGASILAAMIFGMWSSGNWVERRGSNLLDGGAPFYSIYRCADGGYIGVAALEPQFYSELLARLGLGDDAAFADQYNRETWVDMRVGFEAVFGSRPRAYFEGILADCDACSFPVLSPQEALDHPHNLARESFVDVGGVVQPAPGPLFDGARPSIPRPAPFVDEHRREVLDFIGFD